MYFKNEIILKILDHYKTIWAIGYANGLLHWDMETYMPPQAIGERSIATSQLAMLSHRMLLEPTFTELVEKGKTLEDLNDYEKGVIRVLDREITKKKKIPEKLVGELSKMTAKANIAWKNAREKNDFSLFEPYLSKIVELEREIAEKLGYEDHPYDALLDIYEEDWRSKDADRMFDSIIPTLKQLLEKVLDTERFPRTHELEKMKYDPKKAEKVNKDILELFGYPWDRARMDISAHPFTSGLGIKDVRITTRYEGYDIKRTIYSVIHEFGHALYELQVDENLATTPLTGGVSMGVHESQSRFWENIIGRSRFFMNALSEILYKEFPEYKKYDPEQLYYYVNTVKPSFIRVEADELTYNFHIVLRYRIEKMLIAGEVKVNEVPELWNNMMEELLGIKPKTYSEGVLQDVHWSNGYIGYFPTYSLGTVLSAQIKAKIESELKPLYKLIDENNYTELKEWLRERIHKYGSTYSPRVLLGKKLGEYVNPEYYNKYIREKFM